jgi:hypothetical protein
MLLVRLAGFPSARSGQAHFATREFFTEGRKASERNGAPRVIRTPGLRIRSPLLCPAELWAHRLKINPFFLIW